MDDFTNGLARVEVGSKYGSGELPYVKDGDKFGVINKSGTYIINPQFDWVYFTDGLVRVKFGDKWGYMDKTGRYVWKPSN